MHRPKHRYLSALLVFALPLACSSASPVRVGQELPPVCDAFVAKYQACLSAAIPSLPDVARQRAAQTRTSLEDEARRADETALAPTRPTALETKCRDNLVRLTATCGSTRASH